MIESGEQNTWACERSLQGLVAGKPREVWRHPERLEGLLRDACPRARRDIAALIAVLRAGILDTSAAQVQARLAADTAIDLKAIDWALGVWQRVLASAGTEPAAALSVPASLELARPAGHAPSPAPNRPGGAAQDWIMGDQRTRVLPPADSTFIDPTGQPPSVSPSAATTALTEWRDALLARRKWLGIGAAVLLLAALAWRLWVPEVAITGVQLAGGPLYADGKTRQVQIAFKARNAVVKRVEVKVTGGSAKWRLTDYGYDVTPEERAKGVSTAGTLAHVDIREPLDSVFSYRLLYDDGQRSEPFEWRVRILPVPSAPPQVKGISIPPRVSAGRMFDVSVAFEDPEGDVDQLEVEVLESTIPWKERKFVTQHPGARGQKQGTVKWKMSLGQRSQTRLSFVLVDARGNRSQPYISTINLQ